MKKITLNKTNGIVLSACILFLSFNSILAQSPYVPNEIIIKFQPGTSALYIDSLMLLYSATEDPDISPTPETDFHLWQVQLNPPSREEGFSTINEVINDARTRAKVNSVGLNYESKVVPEEEEPDTVPQVFEPVYYYSPDSFSTTCVVSNQTIKIGVFDTGIDYTLPPEGTPVFGTDSLFAPFFSSYIGYDYANNDTLPQDDHGHGTHIAGTIAGIAFQANALSLNLYAFKTHNQNGYGRLFDIIRAIDNAIINNLQIINMSFSYEAPPPSQKPEPMEVAINYAANYGMLFIAAAGNKTQDNDTTSYPAYPASFDCGNLLSVASIDTLGSLSDFSNWGANTVDVAAPGEIIIAPDLTDSIVAKNGSSQATAIVSGIAGLLATNLSNFHYSTITCSIINGVDQDTSLNEKNVTSGFIDAENAFYELTEGNCSQNRIMEDEREVNTNQKLKIYPNPFRQSFNIEIHIQIPEKVSMQLFDVMGRPVDSHHEYLLAGTHQVNWEIENIQNKPGIYYLYVQIGTEFIIEKIVKQQ